MECKYFDVDGFFGDYKANQDRLKFLESKREAILDSSGMDYGTPKVSGGTPSSSVESKAERREKLLQEIVKLNTYFEQYDEIMNNLSMEERYVVGNYFRDGKKTRMNVDKMAQELSYSTPTMYRKIKLLRKKIKSKMSGD